MNEELELFLEDMDDQLSIMENTLLDISDISLEEVNKDMIDNVFRAMHTMKGNAGIFGYKTIVDFAHQAESLLDELRNNRISLTHEMIDLFLLINDHSKQLIEVTIKDEQLNDEQLIEHKNLLKSLSSLLNEEDVEVIDNISLGNSVRYRINVELLEDFFKSGMDLLTIMKYLDALGTVIDLKLITDDIPPFNELNPTLAYVKLSFEYETCEAKSEIIDAFEFVVEDIELNIEKIEVKKELDVDIDNIEIVNIKTPKKDDFSPKNILSNNFNLKVDSLKIDKLINQMSELVIANAKITEHAVNSGNTDFQEAVDDMSDILEDVRNGVMNIRMVQVSDSFTKLRRIVSEATKNTNKEINFEILGGETELDKTVIEKILDPLVHIIRNSVDHGIETSDKRIKNGKTAKGSIVLKAYHDSGTIVIQIIDDGYGINKEIVLNKAIEKNLISKDANLSDKEIYDLIFMPGFSTAEKISDISGRGVGMDVVKRNIEELRGEVHIDSKLGFGTTIKIRLPLTLAIIDGFLVESSKLKFIIPLDSIQECIEFTSSDKEEIEQKGYMTLRSNILPILDISKHFSEPETEQKRKNIVVVKYDDYKVGLKVDELYGEFQTVIKPLGTLFKNVTDISGGTLLGNGDIALILDIQKLIEHKITHKEIENGN